MSNTSISFSIESDESISANITANIPTVPSTPTADATIVNATTANASSDTHEATRESTEIASKRQLQYSVFAG